MKTIILVHGSFQGAYSWNILSSMLKEKRYNVIAPELPGHGQNEVDIKQISFNDYTTAITNVIDKTEGKVVLIGHSMGGLVMSTAADLLPNKVERLIYVTGLIPDNGSSIIEIGAKDAKSIWGQIIEPSDNPYEVRIKKDSIISTLNQDVSKEMEPIVLNNYHPEPSIPFTDPILVSNESWGQIQKHYVFCLKDRSMSLEHQTNMANKAGITSTYELNSDHTPQLSMPVELLNIILKIIEK